MTRLPPSAALASGLFALYLASAAFLCLGHAAVRVGRAWQHRGESPAAARRRVFGAPYCDAIAALRRAIPVDGSYVLVDAGGRAEGSALFVRYDLAPRRAIFIGRWDALPASDSLRRTLPRGLPVIVAENGAAPPRALDRRGFLDEVARSRPARPTDPSDG